MKFYIFILRYRLLLSFIGLALAIFTNIQAGFWPSFILYLLAFIGVASHLFLGPLRLAQEAIESGDMEKAKKVIVSIWFPNLLYKPIRSVYFTIKGSIAMVGKDFEQAEKHMKKSLDIGLPMKEAEGSNKLQLAMLAAQKNDMRQAEAYLKQALKSGLPDHDSKAMAFLQLSTIMANKREFRIAKDYYKKAKNLNPSSEEIKSEIKKLNKYMSQMPG